MSKPFPHLLSPLRIGSVEIRNRIVSTGHDTSMAKAGLITDQYIAYQQARAEGGVGLVVLQVAAVHPTALYSSHVLQAFTDECVPGYRRMREMLHARDTRVVGQLFHPGREIMEGQDGTIPPAYAPSAVPNERFHVIPVPLSLAMIRSIVAGYGDAARRMREAGLDGCEIVASHGYLPGQFLNPRVNLRDDDYGGSLANRLRFLREVIADIRDKVGKDFVVGLRATGDERDIDSVEASEVLAALRLLDGDGGLDYVSVIAGTSASIQGAVHIVPPMVIENGYVAPFAAAVKATVAVPVIVAGRINQPQLAEQVIASGQADACGMTRALIADPAMPRKTAAGRTDDIRACIACNQACIHHFHRGYPISCIQFPETGRELSYGSRKPAATSRRVLVAGGGPAGLKAAAVAAERGHLVTLCEAGPQLGGQVLLAQLLPTRAEFGGLATNLVRECEIHGVRLRRSTRVDRALVEAERPDAIVIATGAVPRVPAFEGSDVAHAVDAWAVLQGRANVGGSVVIAEWRPDWIGIGLAEKLAQEGRKVRLCVDGILSGELLPWYVRDHAAGRLHKLGVEVVTYARFYGADADTAYFTHASTGEPIVIEGVDTVVLALGHDRAAGLESELAGWEGELHVIGDALTPRTAEEAVFEGLKAGTAI